MKKRTKKNFNNAFQFKYFIYNNFIKSRTLQIEFYYKNLYFPSLKRELKKTISKKQQKKIETEDLKKKLKN